jgi:hypothetical protein
MTRKTNSEAGGAPIGSRQGGAPDASKATNTLETGQVHRTSTERERLINNPNLNQAGNEAGSGDQAQGSQTGNDIDTIP